MGIEVRPKGEAESIAKAGQLIGEARQRAAEAERADAMRAQLLELQQREELAQFQADLQMEQVKMQEQIAIEAQRRAYAFELEKMEIRSRNDFLRAEAKRQEKLEQYELGMKLIREKPGMSDDDRADAEYQLGMKIFAGYVPRAGREEDNPYAALTQGIRARVFGEATSTAPVELTPGMQLGQQVIAPEVPEQPTKLRDIKKMVPWARIRVVNPDGTPGTIEAQEWPQYEQAGYRRLE